MSNINAKNVGAIINNPTSSVTVNNHYHNRQEPNNRELDPNINLFHKSLKDRYQKRYESKLDGRFEITLEVDKEPFNVNYRTNKNVDEAFKAINEVFNEKGRLLIVGNPGSGKTVLLLKLALKLLSDECNAGQELPVIFNLASWSEDFATFEDWLIDVLDSGYGVSKKDFSPKLLKEKRITFLLDGLDELARNEESEIAHQKRAKCLASLNEYLREGRNTVICCRSKEFEEIVNTTNQDAPVSAKVEVLDLNNDDVMRALQTAQQYETDRAAANHLLKIIETNDEFLEVLATPFYFITAIEVFDWQILKDKELPAKQKDIEEYLLDRFVKYKLFQTRNSGEFGKDKTKLLNWLTWIAQFMENKQLSLFDLIDLQPTDLTSKKPFVTFSTSISLERLYIENYDSWDNERIYPDRSFYLDFSKIITRKYWELFYSRYFSNLPTFLIAAAFCGLVIGLFEGIRISILFSIIIAFLLFIFRGIAVALENLKEVKMISLPKDPYRNIYGGFSTNLIIASFILVILVLLHTYLESKKSILVNEKVACSEKFMKSLEDNEITNLENCSLEQKALEAFKYRESIQNDPNISDLEKEELIRASVDKIKQEIEDPSSKRNKSIEQISTLDYVNSAVSINVFMWIIIPFLLRTTLIKHCVLRYYLWREGVMPLRYVTFLDFAVERRFLERDGGQWRFRHKILQEYFAKSDWSK